MAEANGDRLPPVVADAFLGSRLLLRQPAEGHRCGTDAVLLAAAAPADFSGLAIDVGAGVGAAGLALAVARSGVRIALLENDPLVAGLACANITENGLSGRGYVVEADLLSPASRRGAGLHDESAGLVITNPPFLDPGRARLSPDPRKQRAHAMPAEGALAAWIVASLAAVAPGGLFILIHRPDALPLILQTLAGRTGGITVLPIYPRREAKAGRILVRGKKGSHAPLAIAPPLVLHDGEGFTEAADAIHRGAAMIEW
ncbi:MAG: tRNA1(Val) (adenine(37)-N6)-methyltransferase [Methylocella sp.]